MEYSAGAGSFYRVSEYEIVGDGKKINTGAINALVQIVGKHGGGTLVFPKGVYITGAVQMISHVYILLEKGAVIRGSEKEEDFPKVDSNIFYGREKGTSSALLWAFNSQDIKIQGEGTLDGGGAAWWHRRDGRRPCVIELSECQNVVIQGIKIINSPFWTIHPFASSGILISNVWIQNPPDSPNTDGINPESCKDVRIQGCLIDVGDDCIALKAGKENELGIEFPPCQDIVITDCIMQNGHGGVVIGSELLGGVRNVTINNLVMKNTDRGIRIKTKRLRGNIIENIFASNIQMENVICPLVINCYYRGTTKPEDLKICSCKEPLAVTQHTPLIRNIYCDNIMAKGVRAAAAYIEGVPEQPIESCVFSNIQMEIDVENEKEEEPAMTYEGKKMNRYGFFARGVKNFSLENVIIENALIKWDVE